MNGVVVKVLRYQVRDALRSRWLILYGAFFVAATAGLLRYGGGEEKAILGLTSIVLFVVPLVSLVLGTVYQYNAREFTELLLAQPVSRRQLFAGLYLGLAMPLAAAFVLGTGVPLLLTVRAVATIGPAVALLAGGVSLTFVFAALACIVALKAEDRLRGLGVAIAIWFTLALLYDGALLVIAAVFADRPLETPMLVASMANPIDLARILILLQLDVAALMGYTGAVFTRFFGGSWGIAAASAALGAWIFLPILVGARAFARRDF